MVEITGTLKEDLQKYIREKEQAVAIIKADEKQQTTEYLKKIKDSIPAGQASPL